MDENNCYSRLGWINDVNHVPNKNKTNRKTGIKIIHININRTTQIILITA
ncbi:unnamed protein product [Commensalibacter communis]|nr:unnamed protein product [Commensalibacter communis]